MTGVVAWLHNGTFLKTPFPQKDPRNLHDKRQEE